MSEANGKQLQVIKPSQIPITEIMSIGKAFVDSGMFPDIKSAAMAVVKIQAGQEIGIAPFAAMTGIHIIQGRPTIGAGLIAAKIKGSGKYNYKIKEHTKQVCSIEIFENKESVGVSTFTIEDAKKAGTKNMDKFPENMLFARAISNAIKWFCPDVFNGPVYTPEEMENVPPITEDIPHEEIIPEHWNKKLSACNTAAEVDTLAKKYYDTIKANPGLQKLFKERKDALLAQHKPEPSIIDGPAHQLDEDQPKEKPVTLYNHKEITSDGKPLITNAGFKAAMQRIAAGEIDLYYKVIDEFSLEAKQSQLLQETYTAARDAKKVQS
jgi:hypothetical protein